MNKAKIAGLSCVLPQKKVTNDDLIEQGIDTSDKWIQTRTGIQSRYICSKSENNLSLAVEACEKLFIETKINKEKIDMIIVATATSQYSGFPSLACQLQSKLKLSFL